MKKMRKLASLLLGNAGTGAIVYVFRDEPTKGLVIGFGICLMILSWEFYKKD